MSTKLPSIFKKNTLTNSAPRLTDSVFTATDPNVMNAFGSEATDFATNPDMSSDMKKFIETFVKAGEYKAKATAEANRAAAKATAEANKATAEANRAASSSAAKRKEDLKRRLKKKEAKKMLKRIQEMSAQMSIKPTAPKKRPTHTRRQISRPGRKLKPSDMPSAMQSAMSFAPPSTPREAWGKGALKKLSRKKKKKKKAQTKKEQKKKAQTKKGQKKKAQTKKAQKKKAQTKKTKAKKGQKNRKINGGNILNKFLPNKNNKKGKMYFVKYKDDNDIEKKIPLTCNICNNNTFHEMKSMLRGGRAASFFDTEWIFDKNAKIAICSNCSHMLWFKKSDSLTETQNEPQPQQQPQPQQLQQQQQQANTI